MNLALKLEKKNKKVNEKMVKVFWFKDMNNRINPIHEGGVHILCEFDTEEKDDMQEIAKINSENVDLIFDNEDKQELDEKYEFTEEESKEIDKLLKNGDVVVLQGWNFGYREIVEASEALDCEVDAAYDSQTEEFEWIFKSKEEANEKLRIAEEKAGVEEEYRESE